VYHWRRCSKGRASSSAHAEPVAVDQGDVEEEVAIATVITRATAGDEARRWPLAPHTTCQSLASGVAKSGETNPGK
jgi:hypothetical protein